MLKDPILWPYVTLTSLSGKIDREYTYKSEQEQLVKQKQLLKKIIRVISLTSSQYVVTRGQYSLVEKQSVRCMLC